MPKPDLSELKDLIPARAIEVLEAHGASLDELSDYSLEQLEAIKGIGPKWASDIHESLALINAPTADETLVPGYFASLDDESLSDLETTIDNEEATAIDPDPPDAAGEETPLAMALRFLQECGRPVDAQNVEELAKADESLAVNTAINILDGLTPGTLGKNLAQDVRDKAKPPD